MEIIFAKTRWKYDSYQDLWALVALSNFKTCFVDEMDVYNPDHIYITAPYNGEIQEFMNPERCRNKRAEIVLWNLERPGGSSTLHQYVFSNREHIEFGQINRVIVSDKQLARDTGFHYITLGSHPDLGKPGFITDKIYDVVHLMCYSYRRGEWFRQPGAPHEIIQSGEDYIKIAPNCWGSVRSTILQESRFMLSIHQDDFPYIEPLRHTLAAAYGLPIISELSIDYYPYTECVKTHLLEAIPNTARVVREYLRNDEWYNRGLELRKLMTEELTFRNCLEKML